MHQGLAAYRLDGDNIRFGLNKDLGFSEKDRGENIRRIAEVCISKGFPFFLEFLYLAGSGWGWGWGCRGGPRTVWMLWGGVGRERGFGVFFRQGKGCGANVADRLMDDDNKKKVAFLFADSCTIALTSFISPYRSDRLLARSLHNERSISFVEVYVQVPLSVAEQRDPKGLYAKARKGEIKEFTGVSAPYEEPESAEVVVETAETSVEEAVKQIALYLEEKGLLGKGKSEV